MVLDANTEALHRQNLLLEVQALIKQGSPTAEACRALGLSPASYSRWSRAYADKGLKGLRPAWSKCGRKPLATLDETEELLAKQLYVKTGSITTALRQLATSEMCSEETASAILQRRSSKHTITKSIRAQIKVPKAVMAYHKSPKNVRVNFFICPRNLTYVTPSGEQPLRVGDLSERDDMSANYMLWVPRPQGGDPCSDRYGVALVRGQTLIQIDVKSLFFQSFCFVSRLKDSYRADDIWAWVGRSYRDHFVPSIGERWERGIWQSNRLAGDPVEPGHTSNEERIGGIQSLGRQIIVSQSPTTKIIEPRFNFLQTVCSTLPGQIGRKRGEMERETKLVTECQQGRRDPREHFLSVEQGCAELEKKLHYVNHEPVEGTRYHGVPAEVYQRGLAERDDLHPLSHEQSYLFSRDRAWCTASKAHATARYTRPDGSRGIWYFTSPALYDLDGEKLAVYFDKECVGNGATVVAIRPGAKAKPIHCEYVEGCAQFAIGDVDLPSAMTDALQRKNKFMDSVTSEYRALGLQSRRIAKTREARDGRGATTTMEEGRQKAPELPKVSKPRATAPSRSTDADYMSRLEREFAEANPVFGT